MAPPRSTSRRATSGESSGAGSSGLARSNPRRAGPPSPSTASGAVVRAAPTAGRARRRRRDWPAQSHSSSLASARAIASVSLGSTMIPSPKRSWRHTLTMPGSERLEQARCTSGVGGVFEQRARRCARAPGRCARPGSRGRPRRHPGRTRPSRARSGWRWANRARAVRRVGRAARAVPFAP